MDDRRRRNRRCVAGRDHRHGRRGLHQRDERTVGHRHDRRERGGEVRHDHGERLMPIIVAPIIPTPVVGAVDLGDAAWDYLPQYIPDADDGTVRALLDSAGRARRRPGRRSPMRTPPPTRTRRRSTGWRGWRRWPGSTSPRWPPMPANVP